MPTCILNSDSIYEKSGGNSGNIHRFTGFFKIVCFFKGHGSGFAVKNSVLLKIIE